MSYNFQEIDGIINEAEQISMEAASALDKMPFCDQLLIESSLRKLQALVAVLNGITSLEHQQILSQVMEHIIQKIAALGEVQHSELRPQPEQQPSGIKGGRPRFILDLQSAVSLHDLGISWKSIAETLGISRTTLYNHLKLAGLSTAPPSYTDISDQELDALLSHLTSEHPFSGVYILTGHLESMGIHLPIARVNESVRRVDADGIQRR